MKTNITQPTADKPEYLKTKNRHVRRLSTTGNHFLWFKFNGKRHQKSLSTLDYNQACLLADEEIKKIKLGSQQGIEIVGKVTFGQLLDQYETFQKSRIGLVTEDGIKEKTYDTSIQPGIKRVRDERKGWLDRDAAKITFDEIKSYCDGVGKTSSPTTYNRVADTIRGAYALAMDKFQIMFNPTLRLKRAAIRLKNDVVLSQTDYDRLIEWIKNCKSGNKNHVLDLVEFMALFGTRRAATANFLKSDVIDFNPNSNKNIVGYLRLQKEHGKRAKQDILLPIIRRAAPLISRLLDRQPYKLLGAKNGNHNRRADKLLPIGKAYGLLNRAYKELGFDEEICGHHHFRHLAATNWRRAGLDFKVIGELLGHSRSNGGKLAMQLYAHIRPEDMENEMGRIMNGNGAAATPPPAPAPQPTNLGQKIIVGGHAYAPAELEELVALGLAAKRATDTKLIAA